MRKIILNLASKSLEIENESLELWINICKLTKGYVPIWRKRIANEDFFALGMNFKHGNIVYYKLSLSKWNECNFAQIEDSIMVLENLTSKEKIERLKTII